MLELLFGWRHASKCKKLVRRVQCRLKLLKNKRNSIVRQLREDVAQLIKAGYEEVAIDRAEQLFKDESIMAVYELLDHFCEFVIVQLSYIRRHKDCPNDINEAVSSLIFASARCGDLPELRKVRNLFGERYGDKFATSALELHPGNLVNPQIRDKLSIKTVPEDVKQKLVDEIARDYCLQPEVLALEYASELHKQMKEMMEEQIKDGDDQKLCGSNKANSPFKVDRFVHMVPPSTQKRSSLDPEQSLTRCTGTINRSLGNKEEISPVSSGENSPQFDEDKVVYLDDVEELHSSLKLNVDSQDKRLFKFKPSPVLRDLSTGDGYGKSLRRRSTSQEYPSVENIDQAAYCNKPRKNPERELHSRHGSNANECSPDRQCYLDGRKQNKNAAAVYNSFTYPGCKPSKRNMVMEAESEGSDSDSSSSEDDEQSLPSYHRAMTMPAPRPNDGRSENIPRSNSCPVEYPNHVHPKLPDYDEIAAKFSALKKEYLQTKTQCCKVSG